MKGPNIHDSVRRHRTPSQDNGERPQKIVDQITDIPLQRIEASIAGR
jgi:hypothetical protein